MNCGIGRSKWLLLLVASTCAMWGCNLALSLFNPGGNGSDDNANDNTTDNTNDNTDDNTNDNTVDNGNDNGSTSNLAVFTETETGFSTSDVRDVDGEIVQFDSTAKTIIWAADNTSYQAGVWDVAGVLLSGGSFQVRFGSEGGERRAYFTETGSATICQIEPAGEFLSISGTTTTVPQN